MKSDGGSAFPVYPRHNTGFEQVADALGMTLRDYFAAKAIERLRSINRNKSLNYQEIAESAYLLADALLKAREA